MPSLSVQLSGSMKMTLNTPLIGASGTVGYGNEIQQLSDVSAFGALISKSLSLNPRVGNPPPRIIETPSGMLNSIGLQNVGVQAFMQSKLANFVKLGVPIWVSVFGSSLDEYVQVVEKLEENPDIAALELNASCPNVKGGGMEFGVDPVALEQLTCQVVKKSHCPVVVKLSPNVGDITQTALAAQNGGAAAISVINTIPAMVIDTKRRRPVLTTHIGGLSGPAIRPIAVRMVWQCAHKVNIPIIGGGGIMNANDVVEFLMAGAQAVQLGSGLFRYPQLAERIGQELLKWMEMNKISKLSEIIGQAK